MSSGPDPLINIDAEAALLGAMLLDNTILEEWADRLKVDDFAEPLHGRIWSAMLRFTAKGEKVSAIALRPIFALDDAAGNGDYLYALVDNPAAVIGARDFIEQIIDLADRRASRAGFEQAISDLEGNPDIPIMEIAGRAESVAWDAAVRQEARPVRSLADMIGLSEDRIERIQDKGEMIGMRNLLVPDLDQIIGPAETGYHILAGRPGMGKTTLAVSGALGYAANGNPGIYCSGEMSDEQLAMRVTCDLAFALGHKIEHDDLKKGILKLEERRILRAVAERAALLDLDFVDLRGANIRRVFSEVARKKAMLAAQGKKLGFMVLDSIGLFTADDADGRPIEDDRKRINFISKYVNTMAHALDIAVFALNQLSRGVESRPNKRPLLSDLKETGNLEQDADTVTFIYREEVYARQDEPKRGEVDNKGRDLHEAWEIELRAVEGKADLIGAKNRHGRTITRTVNFFGKYYAVRETSVMDVGFPEPLLL